MTSQQRWTLAVTSAAATLLLINVTIVLVALPDLTRALDGDTADQQWVVSAYALTLAALLLTSGTLADDLGRRRFLVAGFVTFAVTSLAAGLADTPLLLIVVRGVQGAGAAVLLSTSMAMLGHEFQGARRQAAFGVFGAMMGLGFALGPLLGGALTEALSWRWVFFINVPLAAVAALLAATQLPESRRAVPAPVDWGGALALLPSLTLLLWALIEGPAQGWGSASTVLELGGALVFGGVFVAIERHVAHPMLDLRLFAGRTFAGAAAGVFVMSASVPAVLVYLVLYLEQVLGQSPLAVGLELLPFAALSFAAAPVSGRLIAVVGDRVLIVAGLVAAAAGLLSMRAAAAGSAWTVLLPGLVLLGLAQGLINPPVTNAAVSSVAPERAGMASGANSTARQLGVACGIAGLGAVFRAVASSHAAPAAAIDGLHALLLVAAGLAGAGALTCAFLLPGRPAAGAARLARFRPQPKEPCHDHVDCL